MGFFFGSTKTSQFHSILDVLGRPPQRLTAKTNIDIYKLFCNKKDTNTAQVQSRLREMLPHLDVMENLAHQRLETLLLSLLKYDNRPTPYELLKTRYFTHH